MLYKNARISLACWYRAAQSSTHCWTRPMVHYSQWKVQRRRSVVVISRIPVFRDNFLFIFRFLWLVRPLSCVADDHRKMPDIRCEWTSVEQSRVICIVLQIKCEHEKKMREKSKSTATLFAVVEEFCDLFNSAHSSFLILGCRRRIFKPPHSTAQSESGKQAHTQWIEIHLRLTFG